MPNKAPKKKAEEKPVAKRARKMPLTGPQAEAAIQALRDDAGSAAFRKKQSTKKMMAGGEADGVKVFRDTKLLPRNAAVSQKPGGKKRSTTVITGEPVKRVKENPVFKYKPNSPFKTEEKMMAGGKTRGYGMARGGKACKMM
jgi:hypothetical protein|tara:strand:- start:672 stop:1097 length:426 start_codon:yes stop_codon:yes gene_type:complete